MQLTNLLLILLIVLVIAGIWFIRIAIKNQIEIETLMLKHDERIKTLHELIAMFEVRISQLEKAIVERTDVTLAAMMKLAHLMGVEEEKIRARTEDK